MKISDMPVGNIGIFVSLGYLFIVAEDKYNSKYAVLLNNQKMYGSNFVNAICDDRECEDLGTFTVKAVEKRSYDLEVTID